MLGVILRIVIATWSAYFISKMAALKNCDTLISPKCPAGEPNSINSGFAPNEKPQLPYWVLGAKENYAWGITRMCEVPLNGIGDLSTYWSGKVTKWNGKYKGNVGCRINNEIASLRSQWRF